jgi:ABC-type uncharacterized transport system substrate-binding protein
MMNDTDPVGQGHIDSLARPGGNVTGLSSTSFDLADKRLELLKEIIPKLSRVAVLRDLTNQAAELALRDRSNCSSVKVANSLVRPGKSRGL